MNVLSISREVAPQFVEVTPANGLIQKVEKIFKEILTPLYGNQQRALFKIDQAKDRACYLLNERENSVGVIVFKTELSNEFASLEIKNSIEIKSLFLVNPEQNSGKGLGSLLLNKVVQEAAKFNPQSFHVTVSEKKKESLIFFLNKGFTIKQLWADKYQANTIEYLLSCTADRVNHLAQKFTSLPKQDEKEVTSTPTVQPEKIGSVVQAHWGRVHALIRLSDGTFISGSEDYTLKKWDFEGNLVRTIRDVEPWGMSSAHWVTALSSVNDEYWISGERSGRICLWSTTGDYIKDLTPKLPKKGHFSHEHNLRRVNCLASGLTPHKPSIFIGFPTLFDEYNLIETRTVSSTQASLNDWVYCIHPLSQDRLLAVTAGNLDSWQKTQGNWQKSDRLVEEPPKDKKNRCHITSLRRLDPSENLFGLGAFGGVVKVVDIAQKKIVQQWKEHSENVWAIENLSPQHFASSSDDGSIKIWDIRSSESVHTLTEPGTQISSLLRLNAHRFVAGLSSRAPLSQNNQAGARLSFYDLRK